MTCKAIAIRQTVHYVHRLKSAHSLQQHYNSICYKHNRSAWRVTDHTISSDTLC